MDIIRHGKTSMATTCKKCGCNFIHYEKERDKVSYFWDGHDYEKITVDCPDCSERNIVKILVDGRVQEDK